MARRDPLLAGPEALARFRAGDPGLFRSIVSAASPQLLALLVGFTHDLDEAHDLLQQVWVQVYQRRDRYAGSGSLRGWLWAVARNLALSEVGKERARARHRLDPGDHMGSGPPDPSESAESDALRTSIWRALADLPDREREVVILRMLEGCTTAEAAARMGCAEGTVKATLHHALKKLQEPLKEWAR